MLLAPTPARATAPATCLATERARLQAAEDDWGDVTDALQLGGEEGGIRVFGGKGMDSAEAAAAGFFNPLDITTRGFLDDIAARNTNMARPVPPELTASFQREVVQPLTVPLPISREAGGYEGLSLFVWRTADGVEHMGIGSSRGPGPMHEVVDPGMREIFGGVIKDWRKAQTPRAQEPASLQSLHRQVNEDTRMLQTYARAGDLFRTSIQEAETRLADATRRRDRAGIAAAERSLALARGNFSTWVRSNRDRMSEAYAGLVRKNTALAYEYRAVATNYKILSEEARARGDARLADQYRTLGAYYYGRGLTSVANADAAAQSLLDINFHQVTGAADRPAPPPAAFERARDATVTPELPAVPQEVPFTDPALQKPAPAAPAAPARR
jgi:hypothetical protein